MKLFNLLTILCFFTVFVLNAQENAEKEFNRAEAIFTEIYEGDKAELLFETKEGYAAALPIFFRFIQSRQQQCQLGF